MTLLAARLTIDFGLVVLIWLVQTIIYPSFAHCDPAQLRAWHARYTTRITFFVLPLMGAQVAVIALQMRQGWTWDTGLAALLVALVWLHTFVRAVPLHHQIATTNHPAEPIAALVKTNWVRTVLWSIVWLLGMGHATGLW